MTVTDAIAPCALTPLEAGRSSGFTDLSAGTFDERGVLTFQTAFVGDPRVELLLTLPDPSSPPTEFLRESAPPVIRVASLGAKQVFQFGFAPAEMEAAVRSIRGEH